MNKVIIYRCLMCRKTYKAEKLVFGIYPVEIHCEECEGTATVIFIDEFYKGCEYELIKPNWNEKQKFRRMEANYYKRFYFSEWEINKLFDYEEEEIKKGILILIKKV